MKGEKLYTTAEAAKLLNITSESVSRVLSKGIIKGYQKPSNKGKGLGITRRWVIPSEEVEKLLAIRHQKQYDNRVRELSEWEKGWVAGIIDAEGCLTIRKHRRGTKYIEYCPVLTVTNTSLKLSSKLQRTIGTGYLYNHDKRRKPQHKGTLRYELDSKGLRVLLPQIELVIKERQRVLLLEALKKLGVEDRQGRERLEQIYQEVRRLNKRGFQPMDNQQD